MVFGALFCVTLGLRFWMDFAEKTEWIKQKKLDGFEPEDGNWEEAYKRKWLEDCVTDKSMADESDAQKRMRKTDSRRAWTEE